jgi:hypothetical protein
MHTERTRHTQDRRFRLQRRRYNALLPPATNAAAAALT